MKVKSKKALLWCGAALVATSTIVTPIAVTQQQDNKLPVAIVNPELQEVNSELDVVSSEVADTLEPEVISTDSTLDVETPESYYDLKELTPEQKFDIIQYDDVSQIPVSESPNFKMAKGVEPEQRWYMDPGWVQSWVKEDAKRIREWSKKIPDIPISQKIDWDWINPFNNELRTWHTYWEEQIIPYFRGVSDVDLYKDFDFPDAYWYTLVDHNGDPLAYQRAARDWVLKKVDTRTGRMTFQITSSGHTGSVPGWRPDQRFEEVSTVVLDFAKTPAEKKLYSTNKNIEEDHDYFDWMEGHTYDLAEESQWAALPKVGEHLGTTAKIDLNNNGRYDEKSDYIVRGKLPEKWKLDLNGRLWTIEEFVHPTTWETQRDYEVVEVDQRNYKAKIKVTISNPRVKNSKVKTAHFWLYGFHTQKNQVEYEIEKFDKIKNRILALDTDMPLPALGENLGGTSKLDENNDDQYKFSDDYRYYGKIGKTYRFNTKQGNMKKVSLDQIVGPASWLTKRTFVVTEVNEKLGRVKVRVEVTDKDRLYKETSYFWIGKYLNEERSRGPVLFDQEKMDKYGKDLQVANSPKLPIVGEYLGSSSKLDENKDGYYKYSDDYRLEGKMYDWKFKKPGTNKLDSFDHVTSPSTWLTRRTYQVWNTYETTGAIKVLVKMYSWDESFEAISFINISGFEKI